MRCVSCGADVPPQWVAAIDSNTCPGCGGQIMSSESKELMEELQDAISKMPNDPKGLAGWILSNFRIKKIGSAEPTERFYSKGGNEEHLKVPDEDYKRFIQRTGMANTLNNTKQNILKYKNMNSKYDELLNSIEDIDPYGDKDTNEEEPDKEDIEFVNELKNKGINPFSNGLIKPKQGIITQHDLISQDIEGAKSSVGFNDDLKDLTDGEKKLISLGEEGRKAVMKQRAQRIKAQEVARSRSFKF